MALVASPKTSTPGAQLSPGASLSAWDSCQQMLQPFYEEAMMADYPNEDLGPEYFTADGKLNLECTYTIIQRRKLGAG